MFLYGLFNASLWLLTALSAATVISFASQHFQALDALSQPLALTQFVNPQVVNAAETAAAQQDLEKAELKLRRAVAMKDFEIAHNEARQEEVDLQKWLIAEKLGADARKGGEFLKWSKKMDSLRRAEAAARANVEDLNAKLLTSEQQILQSRRDKATETALGEQRLEPAIQKRKAGVLAEQIWLGLVGTFGLSVLTAGLVGAHLSRTNATFRAAEKARQKAGQVAKATTRIAETRTLFADIGSPADAPQISLPFIEAEGSRERIEPGPFRRHKTWGELGRRFWIRLCGPLAST